MAINISTISQRFSDLKGYNLEKFKGDLNAGIVTGIIAIPLSLALAIAMDIPPIWGLYTAAMAGITASVFAGSRFSVSGPAAAMVPILVAVINKYGVEALPAIGVMAGVFLILFGLLKLGTIIKYVPLSVTLGFTAGIAIVLFFGQLNNFLGLSAIKAHEHFHEKTLETFKHLYTLNLPTIIIGLLSLSILILLPKVKQLSKIPPSLVSVMLCTLIVYSIPFFSNVKTISDVYGQIPIGFPPIRIINFSNWFNLIEPALQVAFLISIESLLCAVVADKMTKIRHRSNQELVAQGIANIVTPFFSGIPSTAVIARTGTSIKNGANSRIAAFLHAVLVLIFLILLAPIGSQIPLTVLSSVLFMTAWKISEQKEIRSLIKKAPMSDIVVLFTTLLLTVFLDLTVAVGVGMFVSILMIFRRLSTVYGEEITPESSYASEKIKEMMEKNKNLQFFNLEGNLSMGAAGSLKNRLNLRKDVEKVIFRLREIHRIDLSGLEALHELTEELKHEGKKVYFTSVNKRILDKIVKFGIDKHLDGIFENSKVLSTKF